VYGARRTQPAPRDIHLDRDGSHVPCCGADQHAADAAIGHARVEQIRMEVEPRAVFDALLENRALDALL
jgi:hypothetical protein